MKLSKREAILIQGLIIITALCIISIVIVQPQWNRLKILNEDIANVDSRIIEYQSKVELADEISNDMNQIKSDSKDVASYVYDIMHNYQVDKTIQSISSKHGLNLKSMLISDDETNLPFVELSKEDLEDAIINGTYMPNERRLVIDLRAECSPQQATSFIEEINNLNKSLFVGSFTISNENTPSADFVLIFDELDQTAFN